MNRNEQVATNTPIALHFACPFSETRGFRSDGFLGAWSPVLPLRIDGAHEDSPQAAYLRGRNWFLCSAVASIHSGHWPKIHVDRQQDRALAFRGYAVDPPIHHFSAPSELWSFSEHGGGRYPNGVFATALIDGRANRLTLKTDAFGLSPLYYCVRGDFVLFGTKADFLVSWDTEVDPLGAATVAAHNYPLGDRSLSRDIQRCPYGTTLRFEGTVEAIHDRWLSGDDLPEPDRPFDDAAVRDIEAAFTRAVRRCTDIGWGEPHLPLSSGYDSRRILGTLLQEQIPFRSTTVRVFRNGDRDLDARHAAEIAEHFGIEHRTVELPPPDEYADDDALRRVELCGETSMHYGWVLSLIRALPSGPTTVIDGFLGDVLAYPGYRLPGAEFFHDPASDIETIAADLAKTPLQRHVVEAFWPGDSAAQELRSYLAPMASKRNVAELAYILLRQRRATISWSQQLARPEHLVTYPYADLDYIRTVMAVRPEDRCASHVQRVCLNRFQPQLAAFPGSHSIPADAGPVGRESNRQRALACIRRLTGGLDPLHNRRLLAKRLTPLGQAIVTASWLAPSTVTRWHWMVRPVCETLMHDQEATPVWTPATADTAPEWHGQLAGTEA